MGIKRERPGLRRRQKGRLDIHRFLPPLQNSYIPLALPGPLPRTLMVSYVKRQDTGPRNVKTMTIHFRHHAISARKQATGWHSVFKLKESWSRICTHRTAHSHQPYFKKSPLLDWSLGYMWMWQIR